MAERTSCQIPLPTLAYAQPTKADFDQLAVEEKIHEWKPCSTTTLIKNDGKRWETRCHSKTIEAAGVMVVFQWSEERHAGEE